MSQRLRNIALLDTLDLEVGVAGVGPANSNQRNKMTSPTTETELGVVERHQFEETLRVITEGTAAVTGSDFFRSLVRHLAQALEVRYAFLAECTNEAKTAVQTLAFWTGKEFGADITFPLAGTPCEKVIGGEICCYPEHLQSLFPADKGLADLRAESYIGIPLRGSKGDILGHLAVIDDQPMKDIQRHFPVMQIFAGRAGVELER